jgi:hypothetical protein
MSHYQFEPNSIPVKSGEKLTLLRRARTAWHNFQTERLGVQVKTLDMGEENTVEIVIPEDPAGTETPFVYTVDNHRDLGIRLGPETLTPAPYPLCLPTLLFG